MIKTLFIRAKNLIAHGHYIPTEYYVIDNLRLVYISIPKVACTSIKTALFSGDEQSEYQDYMNIHKTASEHCFHTLNKQQLDYSTFAFIRSPFDRLVSCYEDKVKREKQHNGKYFFSSSYNNVLIKSITGKTFHPQMSFSEFANLVSRISDRLSDGHFKSQYSTLYSKKKGLPDFIGKFENLANDWPVLANQYSLNHLTVKNTTTKKDLKQYYSSKEIIDLVANRYLKDIEAFGYQGDYESLVSKIT